MYLNLQAIYVLHSAIQCRVHWLKSYILGILNYLRKKLTSKKLNFCK